MPALSGSEILAVIEEICKFGPRWMGSPGAERTVDFIASQFEASGLAVERQIFRYLAYTPGKAAVSINGRGLACEPIALAQPTTEALKAPLVMAGQCLPADLAALKAKGRKIEGSIIVSENLRSFVAYPLAESAGAVGLTSSGAAVPDWTENPARYRRWPSAATTAGGSWQNSLKTAVWRPFSKLADNFQKRKVAMSSAAGGILQPTGSW